METDSSVLCYFDWCQYQIMRGSVVYYLEQSAATLLEMGTELGVFGTHHVEFL